MDAISCRYFRLLKRSAILRHHVELFLWPEIGDVQDNHRSNNYLIHRLFHQIPKNWRGLLSHQTPKSEVTAAEEATA